MREFIERVLDTEHKRHVAGVILLLSLILVPMTICLLVEGGVLFTLGTYGVIAGIFVIVVVACRLIDGDLPWG